jgi:hypothetical protein
MASEFDVEVRNKNLDCACLGDEISRGQFMLVNKAVNNDARTRYKTV